MAGAEVECGNGSNFELSDNSDELNEFDHAGLEAIDRVCAQLYPDQPNPLQATALVKFWFGGPDPLDYISMYLNSGNPEANIPPHWHYISYGFSDLHGDERVHMFSGQSLPSGFGFELTFRLKKQEGETTPPMWPSTLMNRLANYVFQTGNVLYIGDHIPWHKPLDGSSESRVQHMLITEDPQMPFLETPYGNVEFRQIVGVTDDEVKAAQKWKGAGILELLSQLEEVGPFFVTDPGRQLSLFDKNPDLVRVVSDGVEQDGSNLGHVTAICSWSNLKNKIDSCDQKEPSTNSCKPPTENDDKRPATDLKCLEAVQLHFDLEAAELLPMVVKDRLKKGRFFIFHNAKNQTIHLIPPGLQQEDICVHQDEPIKADDSYLQIFCSADLIDRMSEELEPLQNLQEAFQQQFLEFRFQDPTIIITVTPKGMLSC